MEKVGAGTVSVGGSVVSVGSAGCVCTVARVVGGGSVDGIYGSLEMQAVIERHRHRITAQDSNRFIVMPPFSALYHKIPRVSIEKDFQTLLDKACQEVVKYYKSL